VWVGVSDETRQILERFTLRELVERTRIGHPDAIPINEGPINEGPINEGPIDVADVQVAEAVEN
jgi:hypothetical protein